MSAEHMNRAAEEFRRQAAEVDLVALLKAVEAGVVTIVCKTDLDDVYCGNVEYSTGDGWTIVVFNDCDEWDYLDSAVAPDGRRWTFLEMSEAMQAYRPPDEVVRNIYKMESRTGASSPV